MDVIVVTDVIVVGSKAAVDGARVRVVDGSV
jgi:hypothetical protein